MKVKSILIFIISFITAANSRLFCQEPAQLRSFYSMGQANATGSFGGMITTPVPPSTQANKSIYFDSPSMKQGFLSISGYKELLGPFPLRYNIYSQELETIVSQVLLSLPTEKIQSFMYADSMGIKNYFVSNKEFSTIDKPSKAVFFQQVFVGNKASLYKSRSAKEQKQSFNPLDVNRSTESKVTIETNLFVEKSNSLQRFASKRDLISILVEENAEELIKQHKLDVRSETDLIKLFELINR
jgi:hypothetical protein